MTFRNEGLWAEYDLLLCRDQSPVEQTGSHFRTRNDTIQIRIVGVLVDGNMDVGAACLADSVVGETCSGVGMCFDGAVTDGEDFWVRLCLGLMGLCLGVSGFR